MRPRPDLYFATSEDGRRFGAPRRLHTSATSIPDHARMAVDREGLDGGAPADPAALHDRWRTHAEPDPHAVDRDQGMGAGHRRGARWELHGRVARGAVSIREDRGPGRPPHPRAREVSAGLASS